jgi:hypothetical protein
MSWEYANCYSADLPGVPVRWLSANNRNPESKHTVPWAQEKGTDGGSVF